MNFQFPMGKVWRWFTVLLLTAVFVGCSSAPKIDWDQRIGSYTFDQAVIDLGPPDKSAELDNGSKVAEWITGRARSSGISFGVGTGFSSGNTGVGIGQSVGTGRTGVNSLRLTFGPEGFLTDWGNVRN